MKQGQPSYSVYFGSYRLWKAWLCKGLYSTGSSHHSTVNMFEDPTHLWNLHENTFIKLCCIIEGEWLRRPFLLVIFEHLGIFVKHWLPMTGILFVIFGIWRIYFKYNYLKHCKLFFEFFLHFWDPDYILHILKKNMAIIAYIFRKLHTVKDIFRQMLK